MVFFVVVVVNGIDLSVQILAAGFGVTENNKSRVGESRFCSRNWCY